MAKQSKPLSNHPAALALARKIARIEWLAADNAADLHPSFVRLCAAEMEQRDELVAVSDWREAA